MKKTLLTIVLTVLACSLVMGATLALLIDKTGTIENTFVAGDINITLEETKGTEVSTNVRSFKMIPGSAIPKDPKVTVLEGSEACYLFVYVVPSTNFDTYMTYEMAEGWISVGDEYPNLYYREVGDVGTPIASAEAFSVLKDNQVKVIETLTKDQLTAAKTNVPTLSFIAFAVQRENVNGVEAAVDAIKDFINSGS